VPIAIGLGPYLDAPELIAAASAPVDDGARLMRWRAAAHAA
jgi:hypothetical protein